MVPGTCRAEPAELLDHVPARWSYRRVTAEDELKATNYLACPRQPATGWAYLDAVAAVTLVEFTRLKYHRPNIKRRRENGVVKKHHCKDCDFYRQTSIFATLGPCSERTNVV